MSASRRASPSSGSSKIHLTPRNRSSGVVAQSSSSSSSPLAFSSPTPRSSPTSLSSPAQLHPLRRLGATAASSRTYRFFLLCILPFFLIGQLGWTRTSVIVLRSNIFFDVSSLSISNHHQNDPPDDPALPMTITVGAQDTTTTRKTMTSHLYEERGTSTEDSMLQLPSHPETAVNQSKVDKAVSSSSEPRQDLENGNTDIKFQIDERMIATSSLPAAEEVITGLIPRDVYTPLSVLPLPVIFIGDTEKNSGLLDGLHRSKYMTVLDVVSHNRFSRQSTVEQSTSASKNLVSGLPLVHVIDWAALERDCHALDYVVTTLLSSARTSSANFSTSILVYVDTTNSARTVTCARVNGRFDKTHHAKQAIVEGRYWNQTKEWTEPGKLIEEATTSNIRQFPRFLREVFVQELLNATTRIGVNGTNLVTAKRRTQVAHFWRKGGNLHYGFLRRQVSAIVTKLGTDHGWKWLVRLMGDHEIVDNLGVDPDYVQSLASTQIVIVAQQDEWEDHFRLMESLASGAMVMSDAMIAPPPGLVNGTNIVFYDSPASLERYLEYFLLNDKKRLEIARRGYQYALGTQRSWHRMETLLFGEPMTRANQAVLSAPKSKQRDTKDSRSTLVFPSIMAATSLTKTESSISAV